MLLDRFKELFDPLVLVVPNEVVAEPEIEKVDEFVTLLYLGDALA